MAINNAEIGRLAALAKVSLSPEAKKRFVRDIKRILEYMKRLDKVDTENISPMSHSLDIRNVMRKDAVQPSLSQEEALQNAPEAKAGYFVVPKVIEK